MKIIFAQGNPDKKFDHTRHNVGFYLIDALAKAADVSWSEKTKFKALVAEMSIAGEKILLVKPTTYYNETGISARALINFYQLDPATEFLVIHDDMALPFGTIRTRQQGSDAGNNGIKSLNSHIGPNFRRIRVGIWSELRNTIPDVDFVVGKFNPYERAELAEISLLVAKIIDDYINGTMTDHTVKHSIPSHDDPLNLNTK